MSEAQALDYRAVPAALPAPAASSESWRERMYFGMAGATWMRIAILSGLFYAVFWSNFRRLWEKTNPFYGEPNWGHATCVPLIGLYYLYVNREALLAAPKKNSVAGLFIMIGGILLFGYGIWPGQNDFVKDFGMVVTLFGLVLMMTGWQVMKIAWFPIAFLVCGIPWPGLVYSWVAGPLQQLAANVAVGVLEITQVKAFAGGTKIFIYGHDDALRTLNVAEACAGLRSLMTFISVAGAVAFLSSRPLWQKFIVVLSAIPIAIFCNVMRVSGQGLLDHYVSQQLSENFAHQFVGLIMLVPAFLLILAVGWILDQMFVEEADRRHEVAHHILRRAPQTAAPVTPPPTRSAAVPTAPQKPPAPSQRAFSPRGVPPKLKNDQKETRR
jgi:exosortase